MGYVGIFLATAFTNVLVGILSWWWSQESVNRTSAILSAGQRFKAAGG